MLFFSRANTCLANVIPTMDIINEHLATIAADSITYSVAIQAATGVAKKLMNKYYCTTNLSEVYWISMSMCTFLNLFL